MNIPTIDSFEAYQAAMARLESLSGVPVGSPAAREIRALAMAAHAWGISNSPQRGQLRNFTSTVRSVRKTSKLGLVDQISLKHRRGKSI